MGNDPPEQGFTDLYRANHGRVLRFVARRVGEEAEAEDLTAEVFRIAWDKSVRGEVLTPAWLFVTARHVLSNHRRSVQRGDFAYRRLAVTSPGGQPAGETADLVSEVLEQLPEAQRDVLVHRYWDDLGASEIAALTGLSVSAVWVRLHRARQAFKRSFKAITEVGHAKR
ncbi:RNA polymerase sigma factor [Actinoplanes couchii]|uniref:RNA polymerase sigma factor n=1 Tax=Actinoplanes couchii TaxID=403638 RepID=A0ABQ3X4X7_9ACTN|nr:sigma-70 family RNA polymerase sigma factor [Actinoplanes couchii]MDR6326069.1 RNA polymerase sigma-70 factor (ECF subfamily) [Actinoplanes couchii]GID53578.1 RNA polymerase sigma factor [Actinoplanes couchii]